MIKSQLIDWLADELNVSRREAKSTLDAVLEGISRALATEGHLAVRGFGTFEVRRRGAGPTRLPDRRGEAPGSDQVGVLFRPSEPLRCRLDAGRDRS